jgi:hypothetical protein
MREPAPLSCLTSAAYAANGNPRDAWESTFEFEREDRELEHQLVFGGVLTYDQLNAAPVRHDERWDPDETRRFGSWARRTWDGLLAHERLEQH